MKDPYFYYLCFWVLGLVVGLIGGFVAAVLAQKDEEQQHVCTRTGPPPI